MSYLVFIYTGMLPWIFFQRIVLEAIDLINSNLDLLKQAIFPVEVLSIVSVLEAFVALLIQTPLLVILLLIADVSVSTMVVFVPLLYLCLLFFALGTSWIISLIGLFARDFKDIISGVMSFIIYVTPVLYLPQNTPEKIRTIMQFNPMAYFIEMNRFLVIGLGEWEINLLTTFLLSLILFLIGYKMIKVAKRALGDMV